MDGSGASYWTELRCHSSEFLQFLHSQMTARGEAPLLLSKHTTSCLLAHLPTSLSCPQFQICCSNPAVFLWCATNCFLATAPKAPRGCSIILHTPYSHTWVLRIITKIQLGMSYCMDSLYITTHLRSPLPNIISDWARLYELRVALVTGCGWMGGKACVKHTWQKANTSAHTLANVDGAEVVTQLCGILGNSSFLPYSPFPSHISPPFLL